MWVRGLKLWVDNSITPFNLSHPMWVRGLKLYNKNGTPKRHRRTLCGCVD
mgnify:CR=1 FL=1